MAVNNKPGKKPARKIRKKIPGTSESKLLKELKVTNKLLGEIKTILDNTWREILP